MDLNDFFLDFYFPLSYYYLIAIISSSIADTCPDRDIRSK